jgi:methylenetetrahydrofolate dehydrogenase (NADP+) / methenyltetrahydrofolate cyclohydrolase
MSATLIDGRAAREALLPDLQKKISALKQVPVLAIVQVGNRSDSTAFIKAKQSFAKKIGVNETHIHLPEEASEKEVIETVHKLNNDPAIHGIIVQLPLPSHINSDTVIENISPAKDVDCLTSANIELFKKGESVIVPATARGIQELLAYNGISLKGKKVTVVGRSKLVGTPIATMCEHAGALVGVAHRATPDVPLLTTNSDIVIVATGQPLLITSKHVKPGQIIIDVGITRTPDHGLVGDVDFDAVKEIVSAITPVPGGVGPMTVLALFENLADLAKTQL